MHSSALLCDALWTVLSLLCAFQLFDSDDDGLITRGELFVYLRSLLAVLLSSTQAARQTPLTQLNTVIAQQARQATEHIFALVFFSLSPHSALHCSVGSLTSVFVVLLCCVQADTNKDDKISFAEFAGLIETRPSLIPWLQLFDLVALSDHAEPTPAAAAPSAAAAVAAAPKSDEFKSKEVAAAAKL